MKLALVRALYDPGDQMGKMFFNILATFAEFEAYLIRMRTREGMAITRARGNCAASSPNSPTDSSGNSAACMPRASIPSAISPRSSPSQDQPSIVHSTGSFPLSVRSCPLVLDFGDGAERGRPVPLGHDRPSGSEGPPRSLQQSPNSCLGQSSPYRARTGQR